MKMHANARLSLKGRELLIDRVQDAGWSLSAAAEAAGISDRTARKWIARHQTEGRDGLIDRSSAPRTVANRTEERRVEVIAALRRLRMTGAEIAEALGMAFSTVSGILTRIGMGKLGRLGLEPAQRYERARPGELIHIDVKKLGRIQDGYGKRVTGNGRRHNHVTGPTQLDVAASRSVGNSCTSASTTRLAWPTSKFSPTRKRSPPPGSFAAPSSTTPATESPSSG
jgi:transposase